MEILYKHDEVTHNFKAAEEILPMLFEYIKPVSALDVGCGIGTWLKVAKDLGVKDVLGVDGSYVDKRLLKIAESEFVESDIRGAFDYGRKFDVCFCLEVAEHLPASSAETLVKSLVRHSDMILFSAAIPGQQGQNHINEQWPAYWQAIFRKFDFEMLDLLRKRIWLNDKIEWWYRQNIFVVVPKGHALCVEGNEVILPYVHPDLFKEVGQQAENKVKYLKGKLEAASNRNYLSRIYKAIRSINK